MYKKLRFKFLRYKGELNFGITITPDIFTCGITNETKDGYFVPFIDYDHVEYNVVKHDLKHLNDVFGYCWFLVTTSKEEEIEDGLGDFKIIGNYQVFGIDKITWWEHQKMLEHTRCDYAFRKVSNVYSARNWVLRFWKKENLLTGEVIRLDPHVKEIVKFENYTKLHNYHMFCKNKETYIVNHSIKHIEFYNLWWLNNERLHKDMKKLKSDGVEIISYMTTDKNKKWWKFW